MVIGSQQAVVRIGLRVIGSFHCELQLQNGESAIERGENVSV